MDTRVYRVTGRDAHGSRAICILGATCTLPLVKSPRPRLRPRRRRRRRRPRRRPRLYRLEFRR